MIGTRKVQFSFHPWMHMVKLIDRCTDHLTVTCHQIRQAYGALRIGWMSWKLHESAQKVYLHTVTRNENSTGATPSLHTNHHNKAQSNQRPFLGQQFHNQVSLGNTPPTGHIIRYLITCWLVTVGQVSGAVDAPLESGCPPDIIGWREY